MMRVTFILTVALILGSLGYSQEARLTPLPDTVQIGQRVVWELIVFTEHDTPIRTLTDDPFPDETWVLIDGPTRTTDDRGRFLQTNVRWTAMSLEAGSRELPVVEVGLANGVTLLSEVTPVLVRGELAVDEDAPRPASEPHPGPQVYGSGWVLFLPSLVLVLLFGGLAWNTRRRLSRPEAEPEIVSARTRLTTFPPPEDGADARRAAFALSALVRTSIDEGVNVDLSGSADNEWVERLRDGALSDPSVAAACLELLATLESIELGGARPDRFTWEDLIHRARTVVEDALRGSAPAPVAEVAR